MPKSDSKSTKGDDAIVCAGMIPAFIVAAMSSVWPKDCNALTLSEKLRICHLAVRIFKDIGRDLDFLEICAGTHKVSSYLHKAGWSVLAMDISYHVDQDVTALVGMVFTTVMLLRVKRGGCLLTSPCCRSWLWLTRYTMGRHVQITGDESRQDVRDANATALFMGFLYEVAYERLAYVIQEQPAGSTQMKYPGLDCVWPKIEAVRVSTWMGAFGCMLPKPTALMTNLPDESRKFLKKKKPKATMGRQSKFYKRKKGWVTATPALKDTQSFTASFGHAIKLAVERASEIDA